ncbi:MAG: metallophosphoesterase [Oscillospiraceae bacterium]|nr:metallophosphoesterase [Oscillospiraceae bacterium]
MAIFTIGDLHLPLGIDKPMNIFGSQWDNYVDRIAANWSAVVREDDTVVIPGDFSWATYIEQAQKDFEYLDKLPGRKIIIKGNHDYWWTTMSKLNEYLMKNEFSSISFLQNNSFVADGISICGTRGWTYPAWTTFSADDEKYFKREVGRLELSLKSAKTDEIYVFTHYPPMSRECEGNAFTEMMKKYNVKRCYYGHLHGYSHANRIPGIVDGIEYHLVSSDYLRFVLKFVGSESNEDNVCI